MDKLKFRRSGIQARVLALTMFYAGRIPGHRCQQYAPDDRRVGAYDDPERRVCPADRGIGHPPGCG